MKQKFWEGHNIVVKKRTFKIISVSKVFKNGEHTNYFIVGKNKKSYISFCQISKQNQEISMSLHCLDEKFFKIITEGKMYAGTHVDLPKKKRKKTRLF